MVTKTSTTVWGIKGCSVGLTGLAAEKGSFTKPSFVATAFGPNSHTGVSNPSWKVQVSAGRQATTVASGVKTTIYGQGPYAAVFGYGIPVVWTPQASRYSYGLAVYNGSVVPPSPGPGKVVAQNRARTKFTKRIEDVQTLFSGGVFLAELRQTLTMISNPAKLLRKGVDRYLLGVKPIVRRYRREPEKASKFLADKWLEASFGWLPLLNDLDDARSYLDRRFEQLLQELVVVKGTAEVPEMLSDVGSTRGAGPITITFRTRVKATYTHVLAGAVSSRASSPKVINMSAMGLAPRSFAPTLWEVIPWSFLIDYFSNVGDVISGWANQYTTLAWGRETSIDTFLTELYDQHVSFSLPLIIDRRWVPSSFWTQSKVFSRNPISTPPVPGLMFEIPGMGTKWVNMAALVRQMRSFRGLRP